MSQLKILIYPDPFLRKKTRPVTVFDEKLKNLAADMFETMKAANGIGLAASQVGLDMRLFVMDVPKLPEGAENAENQGAEALVVWNPLIVVNPKVIESRGQTCMEEGCLSIPNVQEEIKRAKEVDVSYQDAEGQFVEKTLTDLEAVCFQHELDHLNGKLFIDRLPMIKRDLIKSRIKNENQSS